MNTDDLLAELRSLLQQPPKLPVWTALCEQLELWPDDARVEIAIPYALGYLDRWPDAIRRESRYDWVKELRGGRDEPRLQLCNALQGGQRTGDAGARKIARSAHLTRLRYLDLSFADVKDAGVRALCASPHLSGLRHLNLCNNYTLTGASLAALTSSPSLSGLERLELASCPITDAALAPLLSATSPALRELRLNKTQVGAASLAALMDSPALRRVETLILDDLPIGPDFARALAASPHMASLSYLALRHNPLGPDGAAALAGAPLLRGLRHLYLERCELGDEGAARLIASPNLASIIALELERNGLGAEAARALTTTRLPHLDSLNLNFNPIGPAAFISMISADNMPALSALYAEVCGLDDAVIAPLLSSPNFVHLRYIFARGNGFSAAGMSTLREACARVGCSIILPS
jgi:hypothetical protein